MAQCEKTLDNGERCSNQAIPGTRYCQTHGRIIFKPAAKPADTAPLPPLTPMKEPSPAPKSKQKNWQAIPSPAGQTPAFPGLHSDERNILVAQQGVIWLQAGPDDVRSNHFNQLVRLIGFLSQALALPGQVRLMYQSEVKDYLLFLTPTQSDTTNLSVFYDAASAAARLVNGRLYIGQDNTFVQYRDDSAPRGYDVPKFKAPTDTGGLLLVAHWGSQLLPLSNFTEVSLSELCLHVAPLPDTTARPPEQVYALILPQLYPILAKYFRAHHLRYRLARLQASAGELILFEISPRPDAPAGRVVPAFVLDYLARLPRVALFVLAHQAGDLSILLHWKHRYPFHLPHVADAFTPNDMILLVADYYPSLRINPAPQFFDGDQLVDIHLPIPYVVNLTQGPTNNAATLKLEILLRPDNGPTPPVAALILSAQEMAWLRQLLYRLPGDAFSAYTLCQGEEQAVLLGGNRPIEGIPFGIPLRNLGDSELFIPLRSRFVPDVPWPLLHEVLAMKDNVYTFLTPDYRLDLPKASFAPLSRILVADPQRPRVKFTMRATSALPKLRWVPPPEPQTETSPGERILTPKPPPVTPPELSTKAAQNVELDVASLWREQARACEEANDFLSAAVCYNFLNDTSNSARCYRRAVAELQAKARERG